MSDAAELRKLKRELEKHLGKGHPGVKKLLAEIQGLGREIDRANKKLKRLTK